MGESVKRVLFVNSEIFPYLPESDIANIGRYLPQGIQERKKEIRSFMPRYGCINERKNQLHEVIRLSGMNIVINDVDRPLVIKVASISAARMQVYFIDNEDYFHRNGIAKDKDGNFFDDNDERGIFYVRSVLETIKKLRKEREITQEEFAEVLGVSCQSVSRWENENCYPDIELIPTIADFLGFPSTSFWALTK